MRSNEGNSNEFHVLNNFLSREDQSFEQFSSMFDLISVSESSEVLRGANSRGSDFDGILSYLESRENDVISGQHEHQDLDIGTFTVVSQSVPGSEPHQQVDSFARGGVQCLDVMLNHLQARETSLERSPEYSIELNMTNALEISGGQLQSVMDNRFAADSSENCSSDIPDNDQRAVMEENSESLIRGNSFNQADDLEIIDLVVPEQSEIDAITNDDHISEFVHQPVNLKIDNFVSVNSGYDSDKDIDESESPPEDEFSVFHPYIPSFHSSSSNNESMISECSNSTICNTIESSQTDIQNQIPNNDHHIPLPGEICNMTHELGSPRRIHLRSTRDSRNNTDTQSSSGNVDNQSEESSVQHSPDNNVVEPFQLDSNFDYENVRVTPRLDHYND